MDQDRIQIIALKGYSNSGKTTTLEVLVEYLNQNHVKSAVIKHIHRENFTIDQPGKDTWRMRKAGGDPVVSYSDDEISIMTGHKISLENIFTLLNQIQPNLDYFFLEGFWQNLYPKILFLREIDDLETLIMEFSEKLDFEKIVMSVFCLSGVLVAQSSFSPEKIYKKMEQLYEKSIITASQKEHLMTIPIIDIKRNPMKLLQLLAQSKFHVRK